MKVSLNKEQIIAMITQRIKDEHRKHPLINWQEIAAAKIYDSFISNQSKS